MIGGGGFGGNFPRKTGSSRKKSAPKHPRSRKKGSPVPTGSAPGARLAVPKPSPRRRQAEIASDTKPTPQAPRFGRSSSPVHPSESVPDPARPQEPLLPARPAEPRSGIAVVGRFTTWEWGQNPDEEYLADALEAMGVPVYRVDQRSRYSPAAVPSEWALFTGGSARLLDHWTRTHRTALWTLDWLPGYPERSHIIEAGRKADRFITSDRYDWRKEGIPHHAYLPGACEGIETAFSPNPARPAAFVGALYSDRRRRIADIVKRAGGTILSRRGEWIYGKALASFVQATKVVVGDNVVNDCAGYWSTRNYVIPGAGGFLLTPRVPGIEEHFIPDRHVGVYDSIEGLERELDRWIRDDRRREDVRSEGFRHVRRRHNWPERARELVNLLSASLKRA